MLRVVGSGKVVAAVNAFRAPRVVTNAVRHFSAVESKHSRLVAALDSEIKVMQLMASRPSVPDDFPFKIHHYFNATKICMLERDLDGEEIRIRAYDVDDSEKQSDSDDDTASTDYSDSDCSSESEPDSESSPKKCVKFPLEVEISKGDEGKGKSMNFAATASADEILIEKLITKEYRDGIAYHSHIVITPESKLQLAFREFLEMRGIDQKSIGAYLCDYKVWRSKHDESKEKLTDKSLEWYAEVDMDQDEAVESLTKLKQVIQDW